MLEPCLLAGRLPVLLPGRLPGVLPPGVKLERPTGADVLRNPREYPPSLSLRESGVPPENDERPLLVMLFMGTLRALLSRTYTRKSGRVLESEPNHERKVRGEKIIKQVEERDR